MTSPRIYKTGTDFQFESMIQTSLVTSDTGIDFIHPVFLRFYYQIRICQKRAGHGNHIRMTVFQNIFSHIGHIDPIGCHQRNIDFTHQSLCHPTESSPGNHRRNGRHTCFVPTDSRIDDGCSGCFDFLCQIFHFFPSTSIIYQIQHGKSINDNEFLSYSFTCFPYYGYRKLDPVFIRSAPFIRSLIRLPYNKLVDEIPL